jgi:hypothetical protein
MVNTKANLARESRILSISVIQAFFDAARLESLVLSKISRILAINALHTVENGFFEPLCLTFTVLTELTMKV